MSSDWTPRDISAQAGRRFIITGANTGLGFDTALELARKGAEVVLAVRDLAKGRAASGSILARVPEAKVEVAQLDLASLRSVREFAAREAQDGRPLHVLINNAGVMAPKTRQTTEDGFELQFGTNVLGHFCLTALLMDKLLRQAGHESARGTEPPRVVTLASIAHKRGTMHFDDLQFENSYSPFASYQQSKLADLMLALEMDRRLRRHYPGTGDAPQVLSVAAHPGVANTEIFKRGPSGAIEKAIKDVVGKAMETVLNDSAQGALATLYAATSPDALSGGYYGPQGLLEARGSKVGSAKISGEAADKAEALRLWGVCESLTSTPFLTA